MTDILNQPLNAGDFVIDLTSYRNTCVDAYSFSLVVDNNKVFRVSSLGKSKITTAGSVLKEDISNPEKFKIYQNLCIAYQKYAALKSMMYYNYGEIETGDSFVRNNNTFVYFGRVQVVIQSLDRESGTIYQVNGDMSINTKYLDAYVDGHVINMQKILDDMVYARSFHDTHTGSAWKKKFPKFKFTSYVEIESLKKQDYIIDKEYFEREFIVDSSLHNTPSVSGRYSIKIMLCERPVKQVKFN